MADIIRFKNAKVHDFAEYGGIDLKSMVENDFLLFLVGNIHHSKVYMACVRGDPISVTSFKRDF